MAEWNCTFPEELFYVWGGFPVAEIISRLNEEQGLKMPVPAVARRKEKTHTLSVGGIWLRVLNRFNMYDCNFVY